MSVQVTPVMLDLVLRLLMDMSVYVLQVTEESTVSQRLPAKMNSVRIIQPAVTTLRL